ncbi:MAG: acyl-CoA dehydrogenase family protein [Fibrobacterales bacterium]
MSDNTNEPQEIEDPEMIIDTSHMSEGKASALNLTEDAREVAWKSASFAGNIFMGNLDLDAIFPFPIQSESERHIGDALVKEVSKFLKENLDAEEVDETRTIPDEIIEGFKKMNLFAMKVPKEYNGLGLSQVNYGRVMAAITSWCASTAVFISAHQSIGIPQPLKLFGTEAQKKKYLPQFAEGKISAFALTEPGVGSDPAQMKTTAVLNEEGTHYLINGTKLWCTNGPIADLMVVMAQTEPKEVNGNEIKQITAFIVEKAYPGIQVTHRCDFMGIRAIQNGLMTFTDVTVPVDNIIWGKGKGLKLALATLNTGRLTIPASSVGMAKQCLSYMRRWGNKRKQWGNPIGEHEAGAQKISFVASTTFALEAVSLLTSAWADDPDKDIRIEAAMAKLWSTERSWELIDTALQFRGGRGYEKASSLKARGEDPFPIERMLRDCRINRIIEGTTDIMQLFLAREAMDPHLKIAADLIKKHGPKNKKLHAGVQLASFYAKWYPKQWINSSLWNSHTDKGKLAKHYKFVESTSHKLARTIFHYMGLYQEKLESKQMVLGRLMDIGTELFVIATTCSYAISLFEKNGDDMTPLYLADVYSLDAENRVAKLFDDLSDNFDHKRVKLAASVLGEDISWLEDGVIWTDSAEE